MRACLDDETLAALVERRLDDAAVRDVTEHIDRCDECRRVVADVVRSVEEPGGAAAVGRYVILDCIGAGAMGIVYTARDPDLGRKVALKLLRPDPAASGSRGAHARLLREAQAMARLSHPNVIAVYDVGTFGDEVFLAMELVEGGTLAEWTRGAARSWREVLSVFRRAGDGLEAAHAAGLVHRDFKPDNVLVGTDGRVRVTDFGLARSAAEETAPDAGAEPTAGPADGMTTRTGALVGTPAYMAPEQLAGGVADARSDVFAFCVALYEGLYGERPFVGTTVDELRDAITRGEVRPPPARARVPGWLRRAVVRGLNADPSRRPPSVRALLDAIDAGLWRARWRAPVAATAALLACAGLGGAVALSRAHADVVRPAASAPPRPTALTDLPPPASTSREAVQVYERGLARLRAGEWAPSDFERATQLDPALAAAHLRFALLQFYEYPTEAREHLAKAVDSQRALDDRDRLLLRAAQAWMQSQPADHAAYVRLVDAALARYPLDAELAFYAASARDEDGDRAGAVALFERAVALDPGFGAAYRAEADDLAYQGDTAGALARLDACIQNAPDATSCVAERALIDERDGACDRVEQDAQRMLARDPSNDTPYWILALATYAEGRPLETVRETLRQRVARVVPEMRPRFELAHQWELDVLTGDFDAALGRARELEKSIASDADRRLHARAALWWSAASIESGRTGDAARAASEFLRRKDAWIAEPREDDLALQRDPTPQLLLAELQGGLLSRAEFETQRAAWLEAWKQRVPAEYLPFVWLHGYASIARTREDAERAVSEAPAYGGIPSFTPRVLGDAYVGTVYFLAGRTADALPYLRRAGRSCEAVESPFEHTRVHLVLGQALAAAGDRAGACAAWDVVLSRWGKAKPRSVTAEKARAFEESSGCARVARGGAAP